MGRPLREPVDEAARERLPSGGAATREPGQDARVHRHEGEILLPETDRLTFPIPHQLGDAAMHPAKMEHKIAHAPTRAGRDGRSGEVGMQFGRFHDSPRVTTKRGTVQIYAHDATSTEGRTVHRLSASVGQHRRRASPTALPAVGRYVSAGASQTSTPIPASSSPMPLPRSRRHPSFLDCSTQ